MNKIRIAAIIASAAAVVICYAQPLSPPDIQALLAKVRDRRTATPHVQAEFREERIVHLMKHPIVSTGKVWFEPPNKFRREVNGTSPSVTVCDGRQLWIYYPNFKSAEHYELGKRSPLDAAIAAINTALNLENVENSFNITGEQNQEEYRLHLLPKSPSMKRIFQTFDLSLDRDLFVRKTEMAQPNGDRVITTYTSHSRADIPETSFEFKPPEGTEVSTPLGR